MNHISKYTILVVKDLIAYQFGDNSQIKEKLGSNLTQSEVDKLLKFNQVSGDTVILEEWKWIMKNVLELWIMMRN